MPCHKLLIYRDRGLDIPLGRSGYERRKTVRNLLIIKRKKKRIEDLGQKYSSMFLIGYEGL